MVQSPNRLKQGIYAKRTKDARMTGLANKLINDAAVKKAIDVEAARLTAEWDYDDVEPTKGAEITKDTPPQEFFVDHYCPRSLFLLAGEEGIGKGLAAVYFATQILKKRPHQGNVLVMSTEDDAVEIRRRFTAAGLSEKDFNNRVFFVEQRLSETFLEDLIARHNIVCIVMDALRDYTLRIPGGRGNNNDDATVREAVIRIRSFAQRNNICIIGIHHTNKTSRDQAGRRTVVRERIGGAGAWQQVPRHVVFLDRRDVDGTDEQFAIGVIKSNFRPTGFTQPYSVQVVGGIGAKFMPSGEVEDDLNIHAWKLEVDNQQQVDYMSAEEEYDIVLEALKETQRDDGTLLGAQALWHEVFKDQGLVKKASMPSIYQRIRANGIITGRTVKIEFTDDVIERAELEAQQATDRAKLAKKGAR